MNRVSILIPSYNHAEFLPACLDSVKAQTFSDWNLVAIDDGSSDGSVTTLQTPARERTAVFVNESNLGTYGTLDLALQKSESEYVAVLNSDDMWSPAKLARQVSALDAHPEAAFCYTLGAKIDVSGNENTKEDVHAAWPKQEVQELLPLLLTENRILASSVVFRRSAVRFRSELRYSGDWVALLDASLIGSAVCIPEPLTFWRMHDRNTFRRSSKQVDEEIMVRQSILANGDSWTIRGIGRSEIAKGLGICAMHLSALLVLQGRVTEARVAARLAAKKLPGRASLRRLIAVSLPASVAHSVLWNSEPKVEQGPPSHLIEFGVT
jgi:glycosyltransferase involved in cell wall biosynthesis